MLKPESPVYFKKDVMPPVDLRNFWGVEDGFVWSSGKWCEIYFDFEVDPSKRSERAEIVLDFDVFRSPPDLEAQNVMIYLNGLRVGSRRISKQAAAFFDFDPSILGRSNVLTIDTPEASSPSAFAGTDTRILGVRLASFQVRYFTPAAT